MVSWQRSAPSAVSGAVDSQRRAAEELRGLIGGSVRPHSEFTSAAGRRIFPSELGVAGDAIVGVGVSGSGGSCGRGGGGGSLCRWGCRAVSCCCCFPASAASRAWILSLTFSVSLPCFCSRVCNDCSAARDSVGYWHSESGSHWLGRQAAGRTHLQQRLD